MTHMPTSALDLKNAVSKNDAARESTVALSFSRKYDRDHAEQYYLKHQETLSRRLSNWREVELARQSLADAGNPETILDLPCGAGRFWPMLAENSQRLIYAADNSADMLQVAMTSQPEYITDRVVPFKTSAFAIDMENASVDSIFCMRLMHHIADHEHRLAMLKEFYRVTRGTVVLSLWVDGNVKAWRRKRLEEKRAALNGHTANQNRFVVTRQQIETEFREAHFSVINYRDFIPGYAMWRIYTLRKEHNNDKPFNTP